MAEVFSLPVLIDVQPATVTGTVALPVVINVVEPERFQLGLTVSVYDASTLPGNGGTLTNSTFAVYVSVAGIDYTDRLIGSVEVDAEEGAARVASFTVIARAGVFEPDTWINLPVIIDYEQDGVRYRLFTGYVDLPELSLDDQSITVTCTDNLQGRFEGQERAAMEALFAGTGVRWSAALFGEYSDSQQFADDLLSTVPASADLDRNGFMVFGDWYSGGFQFSFADADVFPESVAVEWGSRREIINRVNVKLDYTFQFFRERKQRFDWDYPRYFTDYLEQNTSLPNNDMVRQAADGTGWDLLGNIRYTRLPPSGTYTLPGGGESNWVVSEEIRQYVALGAHFTLRKRWVQDVKQSLAITVESTPNIERFDVLPDQVSAALDTSEDEDGFGDFEREPAVPATALGSDTAWPTYDAAQLQAAFDTCVAHAGVIILGSARQNSVSFKTLLQPEIERHHFARLQSATVSAQGKCRSVHHVIDLAGGSATSEIELAVFRGETSTENIPALPGLTYTEATRPTETSLGTALQDNAGSVAVPPDDFQGYVGNELPIVNANPFDERFAIKTPDISDAARNAIEQSFELAVQAPMYNQTLTVSL
ncbi:MAG: hypothetical protein R3180_00275 [Marinobacter sp.]|nr:hypothetical protein [Marinobacter sp.]